LEKTKQTELLARAQPFGLSWLYPVLNRGDVRTRASLMGSTLRLEDFVTKRLHEIPREFQQRDGLIES
jgi:hypothetical protein